ncbi:Cof-type HAD-IIB family hydrolase [Thalassobacillus pellis]|uniref:Cof-type HAD-IIB family hydrolase n=1 Tax=Thalassobacillus pellis TaxID=748008 RepID=UPI00195F4E93|nr:Cof-type HAD-IIB family hydrolase [Thalassobacillus pellis]MBM7552927.1 Cof subfamily protein (haloacid dehalogenase superfamily) [Thalassobacillus pellis]
MGKKIAFFDIDGTLLNHNKELPVETIQAIKDLQKNDVYCAIATGRAPFMFEDIRRTLGIDSFISFNGQYVVFEGEVVYKNPLSTEKLQFLYEKAQESGHPMVFMNNKKMKATEPNHRHIAESLGSLHFDYPAIDKDFYQDNEIYQSLLFCEGDIINSYRGEHNGFDFIRWHPLACDVLPGGGSKAEGIKALIQAAGLETEDAYAFGDGPNDIEMMELVGTSVAMGNALPETKAAADHITEDVDEGGLVKAIYEVGLLK